MAWIVGVSLSKDATLPNAITLIDGWRTPPGQLLPLIISIGRLGAKIRRAGTLTTSRQRCHNVHDRGMETPTHTTLTLWP